MRATAQQARVRLRPPEPRDCDALYRWISDRELVEFNAPYKDIPRQEHDAWFARLLQPHPEVAFFMIDTVSDARVIGSCQLNAIHPVHRSANLQIRVGERDAWGQGYGTEAVRLLLHWGFTHLHLHRIALQVFATNARAHASYLKAGFRPEGVAREAAFIGGRYVDVVHMGILAHG